MKYIGKRLPEKKYQNSVLVYTSDGYLLEPYFGRNYKMPFDWGLSNFASMHLAVSIVARFYNIPKDDKEFPMNMKDVILAFHEHFIINFDKEEFELFDEDISDWIESMFAETNATDFESEDTRTINITTHYQIEPIILPSAF